MTDERPWWRALYDDLLAEVLLVRGDDGEVEETIRFVASALDVSPGDRIFDQCCGIGSLSIPLGRAGFTVIGVDLGDGYAARGQRLADEEGLDVSLVAGDAFVFTPTAPCHGAINWWTSFGYADSDADNARMLARAHDALVPGARFILDTMNVPGVLNRFLPEVVTERDTPLGHVTLTRTSHYDAVRGVMEKVWRYRLDDGRVVEHQSSVRAYTPPELARLFGDVGFANVRFVGSIRGEALSLESPRCIVIAQKPEVAR